MTTNRIAIMRGQEAELERVRTYLPAHYTAEAVNGDVIISGQDNAGWTLEDYVLPRMASGLMFPEILVSTRETL